MAEVIDIEKTRPIRVLDSRRDALVKWLDDGQKAIAKIDAEAKAKIKEHQEQAIEMVAEIDEIDAALNDLYAAQKKNQED